MVYLVLELKVTYTHNHCQGLIPLRRVKKLMSSDKMMNEMTMMKMMNKNKMMKIHKVNMKMKTGKTWRRIQIQKMMKLKK